MVVVLWVDDYGDVEGHDAVSSSSEFCIGADFVAESSLVVAGCHPVGRSVVVHFEDSAAGS